MDLVINDKQTRATLYLLYTGQTVFTLGTAISATGVLYLVNRVSGLGIRALEFLPRLVNFRETKEEGEQKEGEQKEVLVTRSGLIKEFTSYAKIFGVIIAGAALTYAGRMLTSDQVATTINGILYRS
jgi:hypothetical protein